MKFPQIHLQKSPDFSTGFSDGWGLMGGLITLICLTFWISEAHLLKQEEDLRRIFIPSLSLVRAKTDSRLGNRFSSNPAAIDYLSQLNSDVIAMVTARIPLSFLSEQESPSARAVFPVVSTEAYFVTSNFFKFTQSQFVSIGAGQENHTEVLKSNSNSAVIGRGLCRQISGNNNTCPGFIYVKGRPFRVSGVVEFSAKQATENRTVFFPLGSLALITNLDKTFISKFAIASPKARDLEALKESISRLQLIRDNSLTRPAFEPVTVPVSSRTRFLFSERFNPLRYVLFSAILAFLLASLAHLVWMKKADSLLSFWQRSLGCRPFEIAREHLAQFVNVHQEYQRLALGMVLLTLWVLRLRHPDFKLFSWQTCWGTLLAYFGIMGTICGLVFLASFILANWYYRDTPSSFNRNLTPQ